MEGTGNIEPCSIAPPVRVFREWPGSTADHIALRMAEIASFRDLPRHITNHEELQRNSAFQDICR
jgi:hypothetical protein